MRFSASIVEFLGHDATWGLITTTWRALQWHRPPTDIKQPYAFHGLVNFYCHFVHRATGLLKPLTDILRGGKYGKEPVGHTPNFLKGLSHEIFGPVYWPVWMHKGLNKNRFWFF
jgi:hypothetical protein